MNNYYVYEYRCEQGPFYVGKGTGVRCLDHLRDAAKTKRNTHFLNKIRKLTRELTPPDIVIVHDQLTEQQAFEIEVKLIKQHGRLDLHEGLLLNKTNGGDGSGGHTSPKKGKTFDEYFGIQRSIEIKRKLSIAAIARRNEIISMNHRVHRGKKLSTEQIEFIRVLHTGAKRSEETKRRISEGTLGKKKTLSVEQRLDKAERTRQRFNGSVLINDGTLNKNIDKAELQAHLVLGWGRGKVKPACIKRVDTPWRENGERCLCEFNGITYDSIKAASEANQVSAYIIKIDPTFKRLVKD